MKLQSGSQIELVSQYMFLGFLIEDHLTFKLGNETETQAGFFILETNPAFLMLPGTDWLRLCSFPYLTIEICYTCMPRLSAFIGWILCTTVL